MKKIFLFLLLMIGITANASCYKVTKDYNCYNDCNNYNHCECGCNCEVEEYAPIEPYIDYY